MSTSSDETIKASTPGYRRLLSTSSTETARESTIQYSQYRDKAPYPARALHAVLYPPPNRDLLHLQGFRTQATGEELQDLADHARVYPGHQYIRERAEFQPFYFFFHGRLKDEETLRRVCYLDNEPILTAASIEGWKSKWPSLKTLIHFPYSLE
ncbi:hypothetical protein F4821DRAFT_138319 [Hypoxylon rubiginosum]|uniref:Uncharacterized protein n=1 Tax=Hypoxylon rubiginosum TaxID=110542 RepID=A0ACC0DJE2_9PEZI|nr:hypothetical protein F4821DRAFT_138319 [Hypoxylon rubiginosum]